MNDQPYLFPPSPEEMPRQPMDPAQRAEILEAGGGPDDIAALERLREPSRCLCRVAVRRLRRSPAELETVARIVGECLAALDAVGNREPVSWLDLCFPLKLAGTAMDHELKRFYLWTIKRRGGPIAARLAVDSEEFRALAAAGWKEESSHE